MHLNGCWQIDWRRINILLNPLADYLRSHIFILKELQQTRECSIIKQTYGLGDAQKGLAPHCALRELCIITFGRDVGKAKP